MEKINKIPAIANQMLKEMDRPSFESEVLQLWHDLKRGNKYDDMFSELLCSLSADETPGLADACRQYIRAWGSGGGNQRVEQCVYNAATSDCPRFLAIDLYRELAAIGVDKTEAYCLITSIFDSIKPSELELTQEMIERNDEIDNAVYDLIVSLSEKNGEELEWSMEIIGAVTDAIKETLAGFNIQVRHPAIVTNEDGTQEYED